MPKSSMSRRSAAETASLGLDYNGYGHDTNPKKQNCKDMSEGARKICMQQNFDNGYGYVMGGSNKNAKQKRKTKLQKKRKNRRTKKSSKR
jgi:hypothetical protein